MFYNNLASDISIEYVIFLEYIVQVSGSHQEIKRETHVMTGGKLGDYQ